MDNSFGPTEKKWIRWGVAGFSLIPAICGWTGQFTERYALGIAYVLLGLVFVWAMTDKNKI